MGMAFGVVIMVWGRKSFKCTLFTIAFTTAFTTSMVTNIYYSELFLKITELKNELFYLKYQR